MPGAVSPLPRRTARLVLRAATPDDAEAMLGYYGDPEVVRWTPISPLDADGVAERLARYIASADPQTASDALHVMAELDGVLVGDVLLRLERAPLEEAGTAPSMAEIGWIFHPTYGGRGLATEAARGVLGLAFDHLGLRRVTARLDPRNTASARVCERLGMTREAVFRQDWWDQQDGGTWADTAVYGLLRNEHLGPPTSG